MYLPGYRAYLPRYTNATPGGLGDLWDSAQTNNVGHFVYLILTPNLGPHSAPSHRKAHYTLRPS